MVGWETIVNSRLEPAPLTVEDESVLAFIAWHIYSGIRYRMDIYRDCDRRDADLMLGLTSPPCGTHGICNAELFQSGCVIYNSGARMRFAIRAYPNQRNAEGITYYGCV